ncbi:S24/S26 family peptidase [Bacillaceae bacterium Marseille-Q3522]|nr:S24/S26 family peptidase [Bacillaceae bacterium Marseille-Q3522]
MLFHEKTILFLKEAIAKDGKIKLPADGVSMYPYIKVGDICHFVYCHAYELTKSDVVLFYTKQGRLIAHRFYGRKTISGKRYLIFKGDTNLAYDPLVREDQVIGKLVLVDRHGLLRPHTNKWVQHWGKAMIKYPFLSGWLRYYLIQKSRLLQKRGR